MENKEVICSLSKKEHFPLLSLTELCVLKRSLTSDMPGLSITHYMNMGDATFEHFVSLSKLIMTPLMKDGCWIHLFYVPSNLSQPSFVLRGARSVRIKQVRSELVGSYYLFQVLKCKIGKTWTISGFQGSLKTQICFLCVRIWKWTAWGSSTLWG